MKKGCRSYDAFPELEVRYQGPPLEEGPLPLVLYFALSAEESLCLDPFNQPLAPLKGLPIRLFSITLPGHGEGFDKLKAMEFWAKEGPPVLIDFLATVQRFLSHLYKEALIESGRLALMGLSRGGFAALQLAAEIEDVAAVCTFAPLTRIPELPEFQKVKDIYSFDQLDLKHKAKELSSKTLRFYIGNRDTRVGTDSCYQLVRCLVEAAFTQGIRSPAIEMHLFPSIGHKGHGTPKTIFTEGAEWIRTTLNL